MTVEVTLTTSMSNDSSVIHQQNRGWGCLYFYFFKARNILQGFDSGLKKSINSFLNILFIKILFFTPFSPKPQIANYQLIKIQLLSFYPFLLLCFLKVRDFLTTWLFCFLNLMYICMFLHFYCPRAFLKKFLIFKLVSLCSSFSASPSNKAW